MWDGKRSHILATSDGGHLIIDYSVTHEELMVNVLRACKASLCLCAFKLVSSILDITNYGSVGNDFSFAEMKIPASRVRTAALQSHTPEAKSITTILLMDICDAHQGSLVISTEADGYTGVLYDESEQQFYRRLWKPSWRLGCTIIPSQDKIIYTLQLSFAVLLELSSVCSRRTRDLRDEDFICCVQVRTFGTTAADK